MLIDLFPYYYAFGLRSKMHYPPLGCPFLLLEVCLSLFNVDGFKQNIAVLFYYIAQCKKMRSPLGTFA